MTQEEKLNLEIDICSILEEEHITTQNELVKKLKLYCKRIGKRLPIECNQSQISKLMKEFNIRKSVSGRYIQATKEEVLLYNFLYDHSELFNYEIDERKSIFHVINENTVAIRLRDDNAQEGVELVNNATNFRVIGSASYKAMILLGEPSELQWLFEKLDSILLFPLLCDEYINQKK